MKVALGSIEVTDEERRAIADDIQHLEKVPSSGLAKNAQIKAWVTRRLEAMFEELVDEYRTHAGASYMKPAPTGAIFVYDYRTNDYTLRREIGDEVAFHTEMMGNPGQYVLEEGRIVDISPGFMAGSGTVTLEPTQSKWSSTRNRLRGQLATIDIADVHWPPRL